MAALWVIGHSLLLSLVAGLLWKHYRSSTLANWYLPTLALKLLAGVGLGLLYTHYYQGGDTWSLWSVAEALAQRAGTAPADYLRYLIGLHAEYSQGLGLEAQPRVRFFGGFLSLLHLLTGGNYWLAAAWLSLYAHAGLYRLSVRLPLFVALPQRATLVAFLLFPSVLFWSSGLVKESMLLGTLALVVNAFVAAHHVRAWSVSRLLVVVLGLLFLFLLKYYYGAVLAAVLATTWAVRVMGHQFLALMGNDQKLKQIWVVVLLILLFVASSFHPNLQTDYFLQALVTNNAVVQQASAPGGRISYYELEATWTSLAINSPIALLSGLYRPFVWEAGSLTAGCASVENLLLLVLSIWCVLKGNWRKPVSVLVFAAIMYLLIMGVLLPLAAPNFGALSRYRVGYLPFFVLLLLSLIPQLQPYLGSLSNPGPPRGGKKPNRKPRG